MTVLSDKFDFIPAKVWSREEVLSRQCPVPPVKGVYFWWFKSLPPMVPVAETAISDGMHLLYVGISPDIKGKPNSKANLRTRIKTHYRGNAEGSTLRRTLGILLETESGYPLTRVGSGKRLTFTHMGEQWLDRWMGQNAYVSWIQHDQPWILEDALIASTSLPLNIKGNQHPFRTKLSELRKSALYRARESEIADESGTKRNTQLP